MQTTTCIKCKQYFRKFSAKSTDRLCYECSPRRNYKQVAKVKEVSNNELEARVIAIEKSLDVVHTMIDMQLNQTVKDTVESVVEEIVNKMLTDFKTTLATSMTANKKATIDEVEKMLKEQSTTRTIGTMKKQLTTHMKAIKDLRSQVKDMRRNL